jgi:hypothetical protein
MGTRMIGLTLLAGLLATPQVAVAQVAPDLTRIEVHTPTYDAAGRRVRDDVKRFDAEGLLVGTLTSSWVYDRAGRLHSSETVTMDADGVPSHLWNTTWDYAVADALKVAHRTRSDGDGRVIEQERERWTKDPATPLMTTVETRVTDGDGELVRLRYQVIESGPDGQLIGRDVSTFDAGEVQIFRHLERWFRAAGRVSVVERWTFDAQDEPTKHEVADWVYDEQGRLRTVDTGLFDGDEALTGFTHEERTLHPRTGRQVGRTLTWTDADDLPLRRMTEELTHDADGRIQARRVRWEHWDAE